MDGNAAIKHMKQMWYYLALAYSCDEKYMKKLQKAKTMNEYLTYADCILDEIMYAG